MQIRKITGKDNALIKEYVISIQNKEVKKKAVSCAKSLKGKKAIGFFEDDKLNGWLAYDEALIYEWVSENSSYAPLVEIAMKSLAYGVPIEDVITKVNETLETIELEDEEENQTPDVPEPQSESRNEQIVEDEEDTDDEEEYEDEEENHVSEEYLSQFEDADLDYDYYQNQEPDSESRPEPKPEPESEPAEPYNAEVPTAPAVVTEESSEEDNELPYNEENTDLEAISEPASENIIQNAQEPTIQLSYESYGQTEDQNSKLFSPLTADYNYQPEGNSYESFTAEVTEDDYDPFLDEMMQQMPPVSPPLIPEDFEQSPFFNQGTAEFAMPETRGDVASYQSDMINYDMDGASEEQGRKKKFLFSEKEVENNLVTAPPVGENVYIDNPSLDSLMDTEGSLINVPDEKKGLLKFTGIQKKNVNEGEKRKPSPIIIGVIIALAVIALGFGGYKLFVKLTTPPPTYDGTGEVEYTGEKHQIGENESVELVIEPADTLFEVKEKMYQIGLSSIADEIYSLCKENGSVNAIKSGTYIIYGNESGEEIAKRIMTGETVPKGIVGVNEGDTLKQIAASIDADNLPFSGADFLAETENLAAYTSQYKMFQGITIPSLEGYIPSGVYDLRSADKPADAVTTMLKLAEQQYEDSGLSPQEYFDTLTIASMIQKEYMFEEDAANISSVIKNRLNAGMKLEIDATVKYALGTDKQQVLYEDLEVDSPYNTYKVDGLPAGPICSGISQVAFNAALHPNHTNYLYYVLADKEGHHAFSETAEQFEKDKQHYLELFGLTE